MNHERLSDAAISLNRALGRAGIKFGIIGGFAIAAMGGARESHDIDCIAAVSKFEVIELLDRKDGFVCIKYPRPDYAVFFWCYNGDRRHVSLIEIFCEKFDGAEFTLDGVAAYPIALKGHSLGHGTSYFLNPFHLFKGKLRAAANRAKFHDSADLRTLVGSHEHYIRSRANELDLQTMGLAMKRYLALELLFRRLGVDVEAAKRAAEHLDPEKITTMPLGEVQRGLLG